MGDDSPADTRLSTVVDRVVHHAHGVAGARGDELESFIRGYFAHLDPTDLAERRVEDLFGLAADHSALAMDWKPGTIAIRVVEPRVDVDGWDNDHTVVMVVTDDLPFLVDSVAMELSRLEVGIHFVLHPVMLDRRATGGGFGDPRDDGGNGGNGGLAALISVEVDRQSSGSQLGEIEQNLVRVVGDVRAAVDDWSAMVNRMKTIADGLAQEPIPASAEEVAEVTELLRWLADDHFILLGYREYVLPADAPDVIRSVPESGLGILRTRGASAVDRSLAAMPSAVRDRVREPNLLNLTKASSKATVHRASYMDYLGVKVFDADGKVVGERRFLGLYTSEVYNRTVDQIPRVRRLVADVLDRAGFTPGGHDAKRLLSILESFPRDELFQIELDELFDIAMGIANLQERRRVRIFARREMFGRFVTCLVYLPRDHYNTVSRSAIQALLLDAYGGSVAEWNTRISESVLARVLFHIRVDDGTVRDVDTDELERRVQVMIEDWDDGFATELINVCGEDVGVRHARTYRDAFPPAYLSEFDPRAGVADLMHIEEIDTEGGIRLSVYREPGQPSGVFKLKLYRQGAKVSLTSVMPMLTNLGVTVVDERPYEIRPAGAEPTWIYDFSLEHGDHRLEFADVASLVELSFEAVWSGAVGDDGLNRLVLAAGMTPPEVGILRAYTRYLRQTGLAFTNVYIERTLEEHSSVARLLVDLFKARFDPETEDRGDAVAAISESLLHEVDGIESLNQDRIIRRYHNLVISTLRTTYFQVGPDGGRLPYLAVKLDPVSIDELPEPRPQFEIFVHSPRFEGVHLRAGPVARGGLRWSDRNEDYRTEVLGLVKAQMVKNAVIVPAGAKGGFVLKRPPTDANPAAVREEVVACYQLFVSGLLDLTDNLVDDLVVAPERTVRYDGDDPYLVVAADKGTATFSDIANELATDRGFWLGDAFASGGSNGYDHKGMGITARGAWESVKRHFRELGRNIQTEPFTAVGIGDMSGDVFGNGMLLSRHTRLVAAFDHRHVLVDPDPDPEVSFEERARLFALPGSSWADYDQSLLSAGGGVYERTAKSIELSPAIRDALGTDAETVTPDELITAALLAPVDLLWNGGIGTYVKASDEPHGEVGDKANDAIRVDGRDLRCEVIGEGGNLGVTQRGRIEFAARGGRIYTDAIDNAAGVDCSDHEVNIKILLDRVVADGDMTAKQRNELLQEMTAEVALLVLSDNYDQTQALSIARVEAASMVDVHARFLEHLEDRGMLDRALEHLPDSDGLAERRLAGTGLSTPELSVLLAYTKNTLNADLLASSVPDEAVFQTLLYDYFPSPLRTRFADRIETHRLRREIVADRICNRVADRGGTSMVYRLGQETSAPGPEVAAAHIAAWQIFELDELNDAVNALDNVLTADRQLAIHLAARQLAERATRQLLRNRPHPFSAADAIAELAADVQETVGRLSEYLVGADQNVFESQIADLIADGAPDDLACRVAGLGPAVAALDIVDVAADSGAPIGIVAAVHFGIADRLDLTWLRDRVLALPRDSQWSTLARLTLRGDLYTDHRLLTGSVVSGGGANLEPVESVNRWIEHNEPAVRRYQKTIAEIRSAGPTDLTTLLVASREVRNLINRTGLRLPAAT